MLIAVTDHAVERYRQRVRGTLDARAEIAARGWGRRTPPGARRAAAGHHRRARRLARVRLRRGQAARRARRRDLWRRARTRPSRAASPTPSNVAARVRHMGFLDKAKQLADQAQAKIDAAQEKFNASQRKVQADGPRGPLRPARAAGRRAGDRGAGATPPHGDPLAAPEPAAPPGAGYGAGARPRRTGAGVRRGAAEDRNRPSNAPPPLTSGDPLAD